MCFFGCFLLSGGNWFDTMMTRRRSFIVVHVCCIGLGGSKMMYYCGRWTIVQEIIEHGAPSTKRIDGKQHEAHVLTEEIVYDFITSLLLKVLKSDGQ